MANEMETFAKVSAKLYLNDKIQEFAMRHPSAAWLWLNAITYSVDCKKDGKVSAFAAKRHLAAEAEDLKALVDAGLFEPVEDGWLIHDFLKSQTSVKEQNELKARRSAAGRKGNEKRWGKKPQDEADSSQNHRKNVAPAMANASQEQSQIIAETETETETEITPYSPPEVDDGTKTETEAGGFDALWRAYPKHTGKPKAVQAYATAVDAGASPRLLLDAATAYAAKVGRGEIEARWVPTLANWLANDTWRDHTPEPERVEPPSESWLQANFDEPLTVLGLDPVDVMMRRRRLFALIRDGTPPDEAAQRIINETNERTAK
ncbi:hypothetical protein [Bifidobacterium panos]|uniref:DUF1376 domain-containing protein n=1 Tax=Bifidobacterium panos TaxID=2675321 RepID=A0ABX1SYB5_9BIFI|nr:hypothetical protein [Bifidobacterium sp. DSM 109963]NMN02836.1 hypothetical protein [Bifidobacterium sp. DSM 109963]